MIDADAIVNDCRIAARHMVIAQHALNRVANQVPSLNDREFETAVAQLSRGASLIAQRVTALADDIRAGKVQIDEKGLS